MDSNSRSRRADEITVVLAPRDKRHSSTGWASAGWALSSNHTSAPKSARAPTAEAKRTASRMPRAQQAALHDSPAQRSPVTVLKNGTAAGAGLKSASAVSQASGAGRMSG